MRVPIKLGEFDELPLAHSRIRPTVANLGQSELRIPSEAFELLSELCGRFLRNAQRRALAPLLQEHLTDSKIRHGEYGSLSQADVLGAIVGLALWLICTPGNWMLLRIPEGAASTPDVFAVEESGAPWFVELKATAPLSSEVAKGATLDSCRRMLSQRRLGVSQLENGATVKLSAPYLLVRNAGPKTSMLGGRALVVTTLPDAALVSRTDIAVNEIRGCPDARCGEHCLRSEMRGFQTSLVSLLWKEEDRSVKRNQALVSLLSLAHAIDLAAWADSREHADAALEQMAELAPEARRILGEEFVDEVSARMAAASMLTASPATRDRLAASKLLGEGAQPVAQLPPRPNRRHVGLVEALNTDSERDEILDVSDGPFSGRASSNRIELAASITEVRAAAFDGSSRIAGSSAGLLRREADRIGGVVRPIEVELYEPMREVRKAVVGYGIYRGRDVYGWCSLEGRVVFAPHGLPPTVLG